LQEYKPLIARFWSEGLFGSLDQRYFRLIDRRESLGEEVRWDELNTDAVYATFEKIFNSESNVRKGAYFDSMTHFDFKTLLPALLHVEDRMSMAHGLESRVPLLDHPIIELLATVPADMKFKDGRMKHLVKEAFRGTLPPAVQNRRDKMGFPVPLHEWAKGELRDFINDLFRTGQGRNRQFLNNDAILANLDKGEAFSRKLWGLVSLELWHQKFHDRAGEYRKLAA